MIFLDYYQKIRYHTMTPMAAIRNTFWAVNYVLDNAIPGAFVECGVWRGGHCMLAALQMTERKDHRPIWLFDTFAGMPEPTDVDVRDKGPAREIWEKARLPDGSNAWCLANMEDVVASMRSTQFTGHVQFVRGKVENTLRRDVLPEQISVLRLDTDWYESTKAELEVLYPRLVRGGVLIIDDYGCWQGCKKAVDEFFNGEDVGLMPVEEGAEAYYMVKQ